MTVPIFTTPIFEVRDVTYRYHEVTALDGLNLTIYAGPKNRSPRARTVRENQLCSAFSTDFIFRRKAASTFCGEPLTEDRLQTQEIEFGFRRRVALVFQNPDVQLFNPTVFDEVAFGPLQMRWAKDEIRAQCYRDARANGDLAFEGSLASSSLHRGKEAGRSGIGADPRS